MKEYKGAEKGHEGLYVKMLQGASTAGLQITWRGPKAEETGRIQVEKSLKCQTKGFIFDPRGRKEPLEFIEEVGDMSRPATLVALCMFLSSYCINFLSV